MNRRLLTIVVLLILAATWSQPSSQGETLSSQDLAFFESKIRPVLVEHCYECHAADSKELGGGLRLDSREGVLLGGQSGPALIRGKPDASLLVRALRYDGVEMPPAQPLGETVVNDFVHWIRAGAPDPRSSPASGKRDLTQRRETLWSLVPPTRGPLPDVQDAAWPRGSIDRVVLAQMETHGLSPTHDADPRTLIRRLYFDLIGLPPSFQQVEQFVALHRRQGLRAIERLVDDLLARPQFGERWGRYWLDVARYGESNGNDGLGRNPTFPHAWRYRDYVIAAFNADRPYDQFLAEQIAGDLLPCDSPAERDRLLVATGFLAMASKPAKAMNNNFQMDVVADQIDVIGRGVMGLSVGCARCHDHKFDPIPTRDYYALAGIFTSTETMWGVAAHERLTAPMTDLHVLQAAPKVPPSADFVETVLVRESNTGKPKPLPQSKWAPGTPLAMGVRDRDKPADGKINIQGDAKKLGDVVPRGFLSAVELSPSQRGQAVDGAARRPPGERRQGKNSRSSPIDPQQSGRLQLARWLTHEDHPLTARVMVNRIWRHLFGQGIVRTPDDFGVYGQRPTHPRLLDHLAIRLVHGGWSIKPLIRSIVLSRTYQLSCNADQKLLETDAENHYLARHERRRLDAEALRDGMLKVSGQLDLRPRQGSIIRHRDILVNLAGDLHQPSNHRSVYLCYLRSSPPPELAAFDLPEFTTVTGRREVSTVPGQALHMFNSQFVIQQADRFARRIIRESEDDQARVRTAYRRAFQRPPNREELERAVQLVRWTMSQVKSEEKAWASLCQALLAANEFRYVD